MTIPIKEKLLRLINKRIVSRNKLERINPSFYNARTIAVIYTWEGDEKKEAIDDFIRIMDLAGKKVFIACFYRPQKNLKIPKSNLIITRKDISTFGKLKTDELKKFVDKKFDYLYHLDIEDNAFIENILARSGACCRVGRYDGSKKDFYEFMIDVGSDKKIEKLCSEMVKYTKQLVSYD